MVLIDGLFSTKEEKEEDDKKFPDKWMIRPCNLYNSELLECKSWKGRFHQYFVFGEFQDCKQWKKDFENCKIWESKRDEQAYEELIASEKVHRYERLKGHVQNDVWKKRSKPPENWNAPLPEWLEKKNKNTYLEIKAKQMKDGTVNDIDLVVYNACTIL